MCPPLPAPSHYSIYPPLPTPSPYPCILRNRHPHHTRYNLHNRHPRLTQYIHHYRHPHLTRYILHNRHPHHTRRILCNRHPRHTQYILHNRRPRLTRSLPLARNLFNLWLHVKRTNSSRLPPNFRLNSPIYTYSWQTPAFPGVITLFVQKILCTIRLFVNHPYGTSPFTV